MYQRKIVTGNCPKNILNNLNLPENTEYKNIIFFYKKKPYDKCFKDDLRNKVNSKDQKRYKGQMIINEILETIKNRHADSIYYLINEKNSSTVNLSDENILGIKYLPA